MNNIPVSMDDDLLSQIDRIAKEKKLSRSAVMRAALQSGIGHVQSGGAADSLTLDSEISRFINELTKRYGKTRNSILFEAIQHGIRAVELYAMIELAQKEGTISEGAAAAMMTQSGPDVYPEQRAVREAIRQRGKLAIQLDDLLRHCPQARDRMQLIEKHGELMRKRYGTGPSMWGSGVDTEQLKENIANLEEELAQGKGPAPESLQTLESLKSPSVPKYSPQSIAKLPVALFSPPPKTKRGEKKSKK